MKATFEDAMNATPAPNGEVASTSNTEKAIVERQDFSPTTYVKDNEVEGEFDANDYAKARLVIVAKTGKLSNTFTSGDMLVNNEFVIGGTKSPIEVVPVGFKKLYQNDLDYDGGEMGDTVKSAVEVVNRGGQVGYRPHGDKESTDYWKSVLQVIFLVKRPKDLSSEAAMLFPYEAEGADYALMGYWASSKTAYMGVAVPLIQSKVKGSIRRLTYQLKTKGESNRDGSLSWIQASLRATNPTSESVLKLIQEIAG